MKTALIFTGLVCLPITGYAGDFTRLTALEKHEADVRLHRFYANPRDPAPMMERVPKYDLQASAYLRPRGFLSGDPGRNSSPLARLAGAKASARYERDYCENVLKKTFPRLYAESCGPNAKVEANDKLDDLLSGWIDKGDTAFYLDYIPTQGQTATPVWSDDYWRTKWGGLSFRYSHYDEKQEFTSHAQAVAAYAQPAEWLGMKSLPLAELDGRVRPLSPAEKYDLSLGDETFQLTLQQKRLGTEVVPPGSPVEDWMGLCHGWAAASLMVPPPVKTVTVKGLGGAPVTWFPADIRSLVTMSWAGGGFAANYIGGRCRAGQAHTYPNGRIVEQECFDTNPATFHLALGNMIGRKQLSFAIDKSFDYEVWNQPLVAYEVTYFDPKHPERKSKQWKDVAADYDAEFRARDRFQQPLTRGVRGPDGYDDRGIQKVVGVMATVVYAVETTPPWHGPQLAPRPLERVVYTYDLELHGSSQGYLYPLGGEWHENTHPDFLWVPRRGTMPSTSFDHAGISYGGSPLQAYALSTAREASHSGAALCPVVKALVDRSVESGSYPCP